LKSPAKHCEAELIGALTHLEARHKTEDAGREMGLPKHTSYARKAKYGGVTVNGAQRPRQLEVKNHRLRKQQADLNLDKDW
jgi:putative transposase